MPNLFPIFVLPVNSGELKSRIAHLAIHNNCLTILKLVFHIFILVESCRKFSSSSFVSLLELHKSLSLTLSLSNSLSFLFLIPFFSSCRAVLRYSFLLLAIHSEQFEYFRMLALRLLTIEVPRNVITGTPIIRDSHVVVAPPYGNGSNATSISV